MRMRAELWLEDFYARGSPSERIAQIFQAEQLRWFLFAPVFLGLGISFYFSLDSEPSLTFTMLLVFLSFGLLVAAGISLSFVHLSMPIFAMILISSLGFALAHYRAVSVAAPILSQPLEAMLEGRITQIDITRARKSQRWLVAPTHINTLLPNRLPHLVRIKVKPFGARISFKTGDSIRLKVILFPPPHRVLPDGYDFARTFWFQRIGATGVMRSPPEHMPAQKLRWSDRLDRLRNAIALHIDKTLPSAQASGIAAALIVGKRGLIPERINEQLRITGLAHILAISGLHMAAFAGTIYFLIRGLLALFPALALRRPIKKWAMLPALFSALVYLVLAGGSVATQRAFIMFVVAGFAVLRGVRAITLRNVAIAALLILVPFPESLLQAGFQLSFAATIAIVSVYEQVSLRLFRRAASNGSLALLWQRVKLGSLTLGLTSITAWAATAPLAIFHFGRVAFLPALLANLLVLPLFTFWIMPAIVLTLPLLLLGWEQPALIFLAWGSDVILILINWIIIHIGSAQGVATPPFYLLIFYVAGGLWLCLWQTRWRLLGIVVLCFALLQSLLVPAPRYDLLVAREGDVIAVRGGDGLLYPSSRANQWVISQWLRADGDPRSAWTAYDKTRFTCQASGCIHERRGLKIVLLRKRDPVLCEGADIVIGDGCLGRKLTLSHEVLQQKGVHGIMFDGLQITHAPVQNRRWSNIRETARPAFPAR